MPKVRTASVSSEASVKLHNVKALCTLLTVGGQKQQEVVAYCTSRHRKVVVVVVIAQEMLLFCLLSLQLLLSRLE